MSDAGGEFVAVARADDVAPGTAKTVVVGDREVALFNVDGTFYALDNTCPHQGGPLAEGWVENGRVTCPWHAWTFNLSDGSMTLGDFACVDTFDVRTADGVVHVRRSAAHARRMTSLTRPRAADEPLRSAAAYADHSSVRQAGRALHVVAVARSDGLRRDDRRLAGAGVSESGYAGAFAEKSSCNGIASVASQAAVSR